MPIAPKLALFGFLGTIFIFQPRPGASLEISGNATVESRFFPEQGLHSGQRQGNISFSFQPEIYHPWSNGNQSILLTPFLRLDRNDSERAHFDIREFFWQKSAQNWEFRIGIRKLFWGVTESQHLVDIINQTDLVENPSGEEKLGQPMVNLALISDWGTVELFGLAGSRERTFPGNKGRLRFAVPVDNDGALYESGSKDHRLDWAVRWSHTLGDWDLGISHFSGTTRDPSFILKKDKAGRPQLAPFYDLIDQSGLDIQTTKGGWLLKGELINRSGQGERFIALTAGFEYTLSNIRSTGLDLGLLAEYLFDERGKDALSSSEDDIFLGTRLAFNDVQSTEVLIGTIKDRNSGAAFWRLEASRRLMERLKLTVEAQSLTGVSGNDFLFDLRRDGYIQIQIGFYF